jgi:hypothetical protein
MRPFWRILYCELLYAEFQNRGHVPPPMRLARSLHRLHLVAGCRRWCAHLVFAFTFVTALRSTEFVMGLSPPVTGACSHKVCTLRRLRNLQSHGRVERNTALA